MDKLYTINPSLCLPDWGISGVGTLWSAFSFTHHIVILHTFSSLMATKKVALQRGQEYRIHHPLWPWGADNSLAFTCIKNECPSQKPRAVEGRGVPGFQMTGALPWSLLGVKGSILSQTLEIIIKIKSKSHQSYLYIRICGQTSDLNI